MPALCVLAWIVAAARSRESGDPTLSPAAVCAAAKGAAAEIRAQPPDPERPDPDRLVALSCSGSAAGVPASAGAMVQTAPAGAGQGRIPPTPGCHDGFHRDPPLRPRRTPAPRHPVPFLAARSGRLPADGFARVGGVQLPAGSRCSRFWATDTGVADPFRLAQRLAAVFPRTGLWPIVWLATEGPDAYDEGEGSPAAADRLDAATTLRRAWRGSGRGRFPGLASAVSPAHPFRPFTGTAAASANPLPPGGLILMLVPVGRPADVMSVLRQGVSEYLRDDELTAVLRSWEERFGAEPVSLEPGAVNLSVGAPPIGARQARRLAAEVAAVTPDSGEAIGEIAEQLSAPPGGDRTSARFWRLAWAG